MAKFSLNFGTHLQRARPHTNRTNPNKRGGGDEMVPVLFQNLPNKPDATNRTILLSKAGTGSFSDGSFTENRNRNGGVALTFERADV